MLILQWAEVLSADAFSAFEDAGLEDSKVWWLEKAVQDWFLQSFTLLYIVFEQAVKEAGHKFQETILALEGGKAPLKVFVTH